MKVVFRVDASVAIGTGHVMRCLTLAEELREQGNAITFVSRELPGNLCDFVMTKGFQLFRISYGELFDTSLDAARTTMCMTGTPDWLIVDHYGINAEWERLLRPMVRRIMVIDDLADRSHDCDLLLDQNLFENPGQRYNGLVPAYSHLFLGPQYALLRNEFIKARLNPRERDGIVKRILVFFGGSDPTNETAKAISAIEALNHQELIIDVVVGESNPNAEKIRKNCAILPNVKFHRQVCNMAELMTYADLAIGAGGTTTWERCFLGLPSLIVVVADNQSVPAWAADKAGLIRLAGESAEVTVSSLASAISELQRNPDLLKKISNLCLTFMGQRNTSINDEILDCLYEVPNVP